MESITIHVGDKEIPLPQLSYEDIQSLIQDWRIAGVTDPLGQLISWLRDQVASFINALRDTILSALNTLGSSISSAISNAISSIVNSIGAGLNSLLNALTSALTSFGTAVINTLYGVINTLGSTITSGLNTIISSISSVLSSIVNAVSTIGSNILSALSGAIGTLGSMISAGLNSVVSGISAFAGSIINAITGVASSIASSISSFVSTIVSTISGAISSIVSAIQGLVGAITSTISSVATAIVSAISSLATTLSGAIQGVINAITSTLTSIFSQLTTVLSNVLSTVVSTINTFIGRIIDALSTIGQSIVQSFTASFSALTNTLMSIFSNIVSNLSAITVAIQGFVNSISRLGDLLIGPLKGIADSLAGFFKDPIGAITKALSDAWQAFVEFTKPIWQPIKEFLDFVAKTVWEQISSFIKLLSDGLQEFLKDPIGFITRQLGTLWSGFVEFTKPIWEPIQKFLDGVGKFFQEVWDNLAKSFSEAWDSFVELTKPVWEPIQKFIDSVAQGLSDFLKDPLGFITGQLASLWSGFVEFTKPIWEPIQKFLDDTSAFFTDLFNTLSDWSKAVVDFITKDIPRFFTEDLPKFLAEDLPQIIMQIGKKILAGLQELGEALYGAIRLLGELLLRAITALFDAGRAIMGGAVQSMITPILASIREAVKPASPPKEVQELVTLLRNTFNQQVAELYEKVKGHQQVGPEVVAGVSGIAGAFGLLYVSAQIGGLLADVVHPFKNMQIRKTIKSLVDNFGGFFIMSSLSASFTFFVLHPLLRRVYQKMFLPVLPGPDTLTTMFFRRTFDRDYYTTHMKELGYAPTFINGFIDVNANIPTVQQMIRLVGSGLVDQATALNQLRSAGWIGERGWLGPEHVFEGLKEPPPITTAIQMFWRELIDEAELKRIYMWQGRHEKYFEHELASHYNIPPISDLVTFVIREVLEPEDFKTLVHKLGYHKKEQIQKLLGKPLITPLIGGGRGAGDWADAYWEAHWRLPSPEQIFEFYNRAVVGMVSVEGKPVQIDPALAEKIVRAYTTLHDYKPEPRELTGFIKRTVGIDRIPFGDEALVRSLRYRILTRIESRFVRRWGLISTEDYMRLGKAQGIDPFIKIRTLTGSEITMLDALTTAEFLQDLLEERTSLRTQILNAFVKGFNIKVKVVYVKDQPGMTEEREIETLKLDSSLSILRFRPEEISWLSAQAIIRRTIEMREDHMKSVVDDYVAGLLTPLEFEEELKALIDDEEVRKTVVSFYTRKRIRQRLRRTYARLERDLLRELDTHLRLYEDGFGTKEEVLALMNQLVAKELMHEDEKAILLSISETRRKRELIELAVRALAKRVGRAEITPEAFIAELQKLGVDRDFAEKLLEVHAPFHSLSVGSLISYADEVPIPPALLEKKLKALRVPEDEAAIIKAVIVRRPIADEIRSIGSLLQSLARDLETNPGEAAAVLQELSLTDAEIELRKRIIERLNRLAIRRQIRRTLDVLLREQYEALSKGQDPGLITLDQYVRIYKAMGFPEEYIIARAQEILANFKTPIDAWRTLKSRLERGV